MSRASTEMNEMRKKMVAAVYQMSYEDLRALALEAVSSATTYEMNKMVEATSFVTFDNMDLELDLTA